MCPVYFKLYFAWEQRHPCLHYRKYKLKIDAHFEEAMQAGMPAPLVYTQINLSNGNVPGGWSSLSAREAGSTNLA